MIVRVNGPVGDDSDAVTIGCALDHARFCAGDGRFPGADCSGQLRGPRQPGASLQEGRGIGERTGLVAQPPPPPAPPLQGVERRRERAVLVWRRDLRLIGSTAVNLRVAETRAELCATSRVAVSPSRYPILTVLAVGLEFPVAHVCSRPRQEKAYLLFARKPPWDRFTSRF